MPIAARRLFPGFLTAAAIALVLATPALGTSGTFDRTWGRNVDNAGGVGLEICTFAPQCQAGVGAAAGGEMSAPGGVAVDGSGNVYVADSANDRVQKFDSTGKFLRAWGEDVIVGGVTGFEVCVNGVDTCKVGTAVAPALGGEMDNPRGIAADASGNVYVSEPGHDRVQKFDSTGNFLRAWGEDVVSSGEHETGTGFETCVNAAGSDPDDFCKIGTIVPPALGGELGDPSGVATDAAGNVYVGELGHERVQKFDPAGTFLRAWGSDVASAGPGDTNGPNPFEICVAANGDTCKIGAGGAGGGQGGELHNPDGIAIDPAGKVYVVDSSHHRVQKFDTDGNFERTWGTNVITSFSPGDTGTGVEICVAASGDTCQFGLPNQLGGEMFFPEGIAADAAGAVYLADTLRDRIQRFDTAGNFRRAWGQDVIVNGAANTAFEICVAANGDTCKAGITSAEALGGDLSSPSGMASDAAGNLYVADTGFDRIQRFAADPPPPPAVIAPPLVTPTAATPATPASPAAAKCKKKRRKAAGAAKKCKKK